MNTTTAIVAAAALVVGSRWYAGKTVDVKVAVGAGVTVVAMSVLSNVDETFARRLAYLILVVATYNAAQNFGWTP